MNRYGVGVVGTGWVSDEYIKAFGRNPHTRVAAICSRDRARAAAKIAARGVADGVPYGSLDEMLRDPGVDIVVVCTPHHLHAQQGIAAARAGKHVVVEKPLATNMADAKALAAAIRESGVRSVTSFVLRWNPMFDNVRAMIDQKLLGEIFYAEIDYLHGIGPWYDSWKWLTSREQGGSSLLIGGCHAVDGLRWFVRDEAVEVTAVSNRSRANPLQFEYDPNTIVLVKFAGGAVGKVASVVEARMPYSYNISLFGDKGSIRNNQIFSTTWPGQNGWATVPAILPDSGDVSHHPFQTEVNHFVDCIRSGVESHAAVSDTIKSHEICIAADISAAEGRAVRLPL
jgi:predicted dehydrogenase